MGVGNVNNNAVFRNLDVCVINVYLDNVSSAYTCKTYKFVVHRSFYYFIFLKVKRPLSKMCILKYVELYITLTDIKKKEMCEIKYIKETNQFYQYQFSTNYYCPLLVVESYLYDSYTHTVYSSAFFFINLYRCALNTLSGYALIIQTFVYVKKTQIWVSRHTYYW